MIPSPRSVGGPVWLALVLVAALPGSPAVASADDAAKAEVLFRLQDPALNESSGLAVSARHRGIVWTHNDGGTVAQVMAIDRGGRTRAVVTLRGIDPYDPEALAPGKTADGQPALFLGDIGDNRELRPDVSVYRFREPSRLRDQTVRVDWFRMRYPDGAHDAEALLVDPRDNRVWIATKDVVRGVLYRAPKRLSTTRTNVLERVDAVPGIITDGAFLPNGSFVLRSYVSAYLYTRPGKLVAEEALPAQEQGESLAVDGKRLLVGSEGVGSAVYVVPLPHAAEDAVSPEPGTSSPTPASRDGTAETQEEEGDAWLAAAKNVVGSPTRVAALGGLVALFAAVAVRRSTVRKRRRRR